MEEVDIEPRPLADLSLLLTPERAGRLSEAAARARAAFGDRTIWHVNATAQGGGVAEMLATLLSYARGAQIENRWLVLTGDQEFFAITKRVHNRLHGNRGDDGPLGPNEHAYYRYVLGENLAQMIPRLAPRDVVVLHDPQTAGMVDGLRASGVHVVWRCHIGADTSNAETREAWAFLRPYVEHADALVFSRAQYVPSWVDPARLAIILPSIDPYSSKNRELDGHSVTATLATAGLVSGVARNGPVTYRRRDGSSGTIGEHTHVVWGGSPPPYDARLVVQVSRWDRLKDMAGVLIAFARMAADGLDDAHLMLAGPATDGVTDDPEGAGVLAECRTLWQALPEPVRARVHLASIPMADMDENAVIVNALQRHAYVVMQKSLVEGFGLTVAEAMWKARPVIASRVGGIQDQIVHERDGLLIDPYDLDGLAAAIRRLLDDRPEAARLGAAARARARADFIGDRHLIQYVDLFERVCSDR